MITIQTWADKLVVNRTLLYLCEGLLEITLTVIIPYIQNQGKDNTDRRTNKRFKRRRRRGGVSYQENPERNLWTEVHLLYPEHSIREIEIKPSVISSSLQIFSLFTFLYLQRDLLNFGIEGQHYLNMYFILL